VQQATDWRSQLVAHQQQVLIGAAIAGFVIGGGLSILGGRRRKKNKR
jgi:LPXTG-motif cell wall-anchored protein